jgi:hypothetical protein
MNYEQAVCLFYLFAAGMMIIEIKKTGVVALNR